MTLLPTLSLGLLLFSCQKEELEQSDTSSSQAPRMTMTISGTLELPEWVDLDSEGEKQTRAFTLRPNERGYQTQGRFYLWGGFPEGTLRNETLIQVKYSFADAPDVTYFSRTVNISPKSGSGKFEEGKAYLITVPIAPKE